MHVSAKTKKAALRLAFRHHEEEIRKSKTFEYIGSGYYRHVYRVKGQPLVVKVAKLEGRTANRNEWRAWRNMKPAQKKLFAPVLWMSKDAKVLVMGLAKNVGKQNLNSMDKKLKEVGVVCDDVHSGNVGRFRCRAVIVDYGEIETW